MDYIKKRLLKDYFFFYTFAALVLKSIIFLGIQSNSSHSRILLRYALQYIFKLDSYRCVFYFCTALIPVSFAFLFKGRSKLWYLLSANALLSILFLFDLWYLRSYNSMTTVHLLAEASNLDGMSSSIFSLVSKIDLVFVFDIPVILVFLIIKGKLYDGMQRSFILFGSFLLIPIIAMSVALPIRKAWNDYKGNKLLNEVVSLYDSGITASNISPIGYHGYDIYAYFRDTHPKALTDSDKKDIASWYKNNNENLPDNSYKGMLKGKNLIVIQVESLEKFVINQKVEGQEITPVLNNLLKNSLYFTNYYEQINNGMSSDSDLLANTSVYPIRSGSTFFRYPYTKYNSLPLLMEDMGYSTFAYHPDNGSFWNWMPALKSFGFQKCTDTSSYDLSEVIGFGISDGSYFKQIEPMIKKQKTPFYSFVVTLSGHMPFKLQDNFKGLKLSAELDKTYLGGYFQCANYEDRQLGAFLDMLSKDNLLNNTVFAIYGDHEGIHRFYPDDVKKDSLPGDWWQDNHKLIPLIIYSPGLKGEEISTIGGQIDFLPTITYLMGVDKSKIENSAMGKNLLNTNKSFAVMENRTVIGNLDETQKKEAIKGLDLADGMIRSNYFKDYVKKAK